jgi:hypothetical protein
MASADAESVPLPADPVFLTPPARVVKCGSFRGFPCCDGQGRLDSRNVLVKLAEEALAPHPTRSPAKTGRISAWKLMAL